MSQSDPKTELTSIPNSPIPSQNDETLPQLEPPHAQLGAGPVFASSGISGELGRLGRYRIQKELGRGGMGAVYLALDERLQRRVALKVMLPEAAADSVSKERFLREARAAAQVACDHVVSIFEAEEIDGMPYISLQFLEGCTLDQYVQKYGRPSIPQIIRIGQETAIGLEAAHRLGLVHRDVKPANLWLESPHGRVKILDFGLARPRTEIGILTDTGHVMGTPAYMSPEQARGLPLDGRSDLFSLGTVLYQLCTGQLPFQGESVMDVLKALSLDDPKPVRSLTPQVPEGLANLIHRLLAKRPADRPASAQNVEEELKSLSDVSQSPAVGGQPQVIYVPMATPVHESKPAQEATEFQLPSSQIVLEIAAEPRKKLASLAWLVALLFGIVLVVFFGREYLKRDNGDAAKIATEEITPVPPKPTETKANPPKVEPPVTTKDSDRLAAEYVLSVGGGIKINHNEAELTKITELPGEPFQLTLANLEGNAKVTDAGLASFAGCKHLVYLNLNGTKITDAGVANFKDCKYVRVLNLTKTKVSDAGFANFKDCKQLRRLDIGNMQITGAGLASFAECLLVQEVYLQQAPVGNGAMAHFKKCRNLARVRLDGTNFGDEGVKDLLDKTDLQTLDLRDTQVTAAGLDAVKAALPRCRITHDGGVIEPKK